MDDAAKLPEPYTRAEVEALRVGSAMSTIRRLIATLDMRDADCEQKVAEAADAGYTNGCRDSR